MKSKRSAKEILAGTGGGNFLDKAQLVKDKTTFVVEGFTFRKGGGYEKGTDAWTVNVRLGKKEAAIGFPANDVRDSIFGELSEAVPFKARCVVVQQPKKKGQSPTYGLEAL